MMRFFFTFLRVDFVNSFSYTEIIPPHKKTLKSALHNIIILSLEKEKGVKNENSFFAITFELKEVSKFVLI